MLAAAASLAPTCERTVPVRSSDVATRDTELHLTIDGDAVTTRWRVWMLGPGGPVRLEAGDQLRVDGRAMVAAGDDHTITTPPALDGAVLAYARQGGAEDVVVDVELPPLAAIVLPGEARRGEALAVRWTPAPGPWATIVAVEGACLPPIEVRLPPGEDDGVASIDLDAVEVGGCPVAVRITRLVARELDAPPLARAPSRIQRATEATIPIVD